MYRNNSRLKALIFSLIIGQNLIYSMEKQNQNDTSLEPVSYIDPTNFYKTPKKKLNQMVGNIPPKILRIIHILKNIPIEKIGINEEINNIILYGAPGTGKSSIAECIATEIGAHFYHLAGSDIINSYQASGVTTIKKLFEHIHLKDFLTILFIDEIDVIINTKDSRSEEASGVKVRLQKELDQKSPQVICLFATNYLNKIPNEILSRFDLIEIPLPSPDVIFELLKFYSKNKTNLDDNFFKKIAYKLDGLSCRDIQKIVNTASLLKLERQEKNITEEDYIISISEALVIPLTQIMRTKLIQYYLNHRISASLKPNILQNVAEETEGFIAKDIENAVNNSIIFINLNGKLDLNAFYAGIYYDQKVKFAQPDIREKIIKYFFNYHNINLDEEICQDLIKYTNSENFTAKELKSIVDQAMFNAEEKGREIIEEDIYIALYKELQKKSVATEVTKTKYTEIKTRGSINGSLGASGSTGAEKILPNINASGSIGINWSPKFMDSEETITTEDRRTLAQNEHFLKQSSEGDRILKTSRLDYINKNLPGVKARANLIKYFLSKIKHKLTEDEIMEFIVKSKGLSWYSIDESIKETFDIATKIDEIYHMEYKHLRYILYTNYDILLDKNPNKSKESEETLKKSEKEHDIKEQSGGCLLM